MNVSIIRILLIEFFSHILKKLFHKIQIAEGLTSGLLPLVPLSAVNPVFVFVVSHSLNDSLFL